MVVDGIEYWREGVAAGCTVRPMFQLIDPMLMAEVDEASWPEPTAAYDLDSVFWTRCSGEL